MLAEASSRDVTVKYGAGGCSQKMEWSIDRPSVNTPTSPDGSHMGDGHLVRPGNRLPPSSGNMFSPLSPQAGSAQDLSSPHGVNNPPNAHVHSGGGTTGGGDSTPSAGGLGPAPGHSGAPPGMHNANSPLIIPQPTRPPRQIRTYHCRMCDQIFDSRSDLLVHSQHVHKQDPKPYKCPTCNKSFANSSYLSQHARIHSGIKPYKCQICERRFTQLCHLQQHIRTHTGEKPYKCKHPSCGKAFSQLSNLQSHSRSHMTDRPYRCNSCYKCFADEQSLREHIPKHSETKHLKTHICKVCGKSYTQETYLARHMTKHSGEGPTVNMAGGSSGSSSAPLDSPGLSRDLKSYHQYNGPMNTVPKSLPSSAPSMSSPAHHLDIGKMSNMDAPCANMLRHDPMEKTSAFMPLPPQLGPSTGFMGNGSVPSNFPFPPPRLPSNTLNSSLSHISPPATSSRYFPFEPIPPLKHDTMMDHMIAGRLLSQQQIKDFSTSHPVFPKSEPSSPASHHGHREFN